MSRNARLEIQVSQPERAIKFYAETFGWRFEKHNGRDGCWLVTGGRESRANSCRAIMRHCRTIAAPIVNSIEVDSVDEYIARVIANGGRVVAAKMTIPDIGYLAYCQDTEENIFGIFEEDASARPSCH